MDALIPFLIVGGVVTVGLFLLHTVLRFVGGTLKWGITIAVLVFFFGWGALANIPSKLIELGNTVASTNVSVKINGQDIRCSVVPTKQQAEETINKIKPAIDGVLGSISKYTTVTVTENKDCAGRASVTVKSEDIEKLKQALGGLQALLPNIPVSIGQ